MAKLNKFLSILLFFFLFVFVFSFQAIAANKTELYFFYGEGCPHCSNAKPFLEKLKIEYPNLNVKSYEIYNNKENRKLFSALGDACAEDISGVPAFFIGDDAFVGYASSMDNHIRQLVENCLANNCESPIEKLNKKIAIDSGSQNKKNNNNFIESNFTEKQDQDKNLKFIFLLIFVASSPFGFIFFKKFINRK